MRKVNQHLDVTFVAPTFSDALVIAPLLDDLLLRLKCSYEHLVNYPSKYNLNDDVKGFSMLRRQIQVLMDCGFQPSIEIGSDLDTIMATTAEEIECKATKKLEEEPKQAPSPYLPVLLLFLGY